MDGILNSNRLTLIFLQKVGKLKVRRRVLELSKDKESKLKNKSKEELNGKSLKKGNKKLNGPNRPSV